MIYLDHAATTNVCQGAAEAAYRIMTTDFGNPSSMHRMGLEAEKIIKQARMTLARMIGAEESEITFTSSGTEANNLAILGALKHRAESGRTGHIITTAIEHKAVLNPVAELEKKGFRVSYLGTDSEGRISLGDLEQALCSETALVSIMAVNNETGAVQPYEEACDLVKRYNPSILFHCDAIQLLGKLPMSMKRFKADFVAMSGHKVHAPKGVGALYIRKGHTIEPLLLGGGQERGLKPGTENVPAIGAFSEALKVMESDLGHEAQRMTALRAAFINRIISGYEGVKVLSPMSGALSPYIVTLAFEGLKGEVLLHSLEMKGIYVSTGSACNSKTKVYSHVLNAMGLPDEVKEGAVRFSFSRFTTEEELATAAESVIETAAELKRIIKGKRRL